MFEGGYYYDFAEWGEPEALTREKMGYGDNTYFWEEDGQTKVSSSGSYNFYEYTMAVTENGTKPFGREHNVDIRRFANPIIER